MLDTVYRQEYLRVRVIDNQVIVIVDLNEHIVGQVCIKDYLASLTLCGKLYFMAWENISTVFEWNFNRRTLF